MNLNGGVHGIGRGASASRRCETAGATRECIVLHEAAASAGCAMIPIFWGTRLKRRCVGRVADFCPLCREIRPFRLFHRHCQYHVALIGMGEGPADAIDVECEHCGARVLREGYPYATALRDRSASLDELVAATNPRIPELYRERLEMEARVRRRRLGSMERNALLREPFELLGPAIVADFRMTHGESKTILLSGMLFVGLVFLTSELVSSDWTPIMVAASICALAGFMVLLARRTTRYIRRTCIPCLAMSLEPLRPTAEELDAVMAHLVGPGQLLARYVRTDVLLRQIERAALKRPDSPVLS